MRTRALLATLLAFLCAAGSTSAQTTVVYAGTFWSTALNQGGTVIMTLLFWPNDSLSGTIDTDNYPGDALLCGAGSITGERLMDSLIYQYTSFDTDSGCGFDWGIVIYMRGMLHNGMDSIHATFSINPTPGVEGAGDHYLSVVQLPTAVANAAQPPTLAVAPNPTTGSFSLLLPTSHTEGTLLLMDPAGRLTHQQRFAAGAARIALDFTDDQPGLYLLELRFADGTRAVERVVRQ